jgi:hypothetical protein
MRIGSAHNHGVGEIAPAIGDVDQHLSEPRDRLRCFAHPEIVFTPGASTMFARKKPRPSLFGRSRTRPKRVGGCHVQGPASDDNAIVRFRLFRRNIAVEHIAQHGLRVSFQWVSAAAADRPDRHQPVAVARSPIGTLDGRAASTADAGRSERDAVEPSSPPAKPHGRYLCPSPSTENAPSDRKRIGERSRCRLAICPSPEPDRAARSG